MSIRNSTPNDDEWDRITVSEGTESIVVEQFGDDEPQVWVHTMGDCERYSIAELVELAGLTD